MDYTKTQWLKEHCDEIVFHRDVSNPRIEILFCYRSTGCPGSVEVPMRTLLAEAVELAMLEQAN